MRLECWVMHAGYLSELSGLSCSLEPFLLQAGKLSEVHRPGQAELGFGFTIPALHVACFARRLVCVLAAGSAEAFLRLNFARIAPSSGLAGVLQGSAPPGGKTMGDIGAALPGSETPPPAPHCLRGEVQRPSLEAERAPHAPAPPRLSGPLSAAPTSSSAGPARPEPQSPHLPGTWSRRVPQAPSALRLFPFPRLTLRPGSAQASWVLQPIPVLPLPPTNTCASFLYFRI